jgi:hypothetical protein
MTQVQHLKLLLILIFWRSAFYSHGNHERVHVYAFANAFPGHSHWCWFGPNIKNGCGRPCIFALEWLVPIMVLEKHNVLSYVWPVNGIQNRGESAVRYFPEQMASIPKYCSTYSQTLFISWYLWSTCLRSVSWAYYTYPSTKTVNCWVEV